MRVIIAGGRDFCMPNGEQNPYKGQTEVALAVQESGFMPISQVVCGMANGADLMGWYWAKHYGIPIAEFPAQWKLHGKAAGFKRNVQMAENSDALIAFWDGTSRGTKHMIDIATRMGLKVFVKRY